ncbi:hypothetical protein BYT27DRAFT_7194039 [Phlegmacium glaucopus]|nr:hypothetical protein BYT27DRAFT_7194039 [Phlegmacium glaucopus]
MVVRVLARHQVAFRQSYDHVFRTKYTIQLVLQSFDFEVRNKSLFVGWFKFLNSGNIPFRFRISVHDVLDPFLASCLATMRVSLNRSCCFSQQTISPFNSAPCALLSRANRATPRSNISSCCYASTRRFSASCDSYTSELVPEFSEFGLKLRQEKFKFSVTFFEVSDEFRVVYWGFENADLCAYFFAWKH